MAATFPYRGSVELAGAAGYNSVTFAPEGGYGDLQGQSVFTHGLQVGMEGSNARDLRAATTPLMQRLAQNNPSLRQNGGFSNVQFAGRAGPGDGIDEHVCHAPAGGHCALHNAAERRQLVFRRRRGAGERIPRVSVIFNRSVQSLQLNDGYRNSRF